MDRGHLFAGVAGYVGRPDAPGAVGVFRRPINVSGEWRHVLQGLEAHYVLVHPANPDWVFAGTSDGVYRSHDNGATFTRADFPDADQRIWCIHTDLRDPRRMYAGASPIGVYLSEDAGVTWRALPKPALLPRCRGPFENRLMRLAQDPERPERLFAALEIAGAMVSHDNGETWSDCSEALVALSRQPRLSSQIVTDSMSEGMLDGHAIAIAPSRSNRPVLALRMGLFETADNGARWHDMEVGRFSPYTYARDVRAAPTQPSTLYAGLSIAASSDAGALYRSDDAGETWDRFDKVTVRGTVMSIALHSRDPDQVYIGARYHGEVFGTRDGGESWSDYTIAQPVKDIYCVACG